MRDLFYGSPHDSIEQTCVVCGRPYVVHRQPGKSKPHRCPRAVLAGMAAAERRAENEDDPELPSPRQRMSDARTFSERLAAGFGMRGGRQCA